MSSKIIERDDYVIIREFAKKYNMSVADFGRSIVRQSERTLGRAVRLTEEEYEYITKKAKENNMSVTRFCALACHTYLNKENKDIPVENIYSEKTKRNKRIEVRIYNGDDEIKMNKISIEYSIKISALIRYCALQYNGKNS